ncbi:hypothetical protein KAW38_04710 [Candidatus Micrarchaeota archaeon]|nr:hypothetical protein [Candidatus Micrarchaeota archaeon]
MRLLKTDEFKGDLKQLEGSLKRELKKIIEKVIVNPKESKPLKYVKNVFSLRIKNKRLLYLFEKNSIVFLCFKSRDEVYEWLKRNF